MIATCIEYIKDPTSSSPKAALNKVAYQRTMDDVIVPWNSPPSPELLTNLPPAKGNAYYHAGEIYNCRCYPEPLLEVSDVRWPHKVYYLGKIQTMTRQQFEKIY